MRSRVEGKTWAFSERSRPADSLAGPLSASALGLVEDSGDIGRRLGIS